MSPIFVQGVEVGQIQGQPLSVFMKIKKSQVIWQAMHYAKAPANAEIEKLKSMRKVHKKFMLQI